MSYAQSLDGRLATSTGDSQWISGPETLDLAQGLRRDNELILVGVRTIIRDDPALTCRLPGCTSPTRVVLDSTLRIPPQSRVVQTADSPSTMVIHTDLAPSDRLRELSARGVILRRVASDDRGRPGVHAVLDMLGSEGYSTLFVEGGGGVITSFLGAGVVDRLVVVTAPMLIGSGIEAVGELGIRDLSAALRPQRVKVERLGADMVWDMDFRTG